MTTPGPATTGPGAAPVARDVDVLAEPVAEAVLACPGVARLSAGPFGTVGTYLPGRRITGVRITDDAVTIRIVARPVPVASLETRILAVVAAIVPGLPIDIGVDDLELDTATPGA